MDNADVGSQGRAVGHAASIRPPVFGGASKIIVKRERIDRAGTHHARQPRNPIDDLLSPRDDMTRPVRQRNAGQVHLQTCHDDALRIEARVNAAEREEASGHQHRANHEHDRQTNLCDHQGSQGALPATRHAACPFEVLLRFRESSSEGRHKPEQHTGHERNEKAERHNAPVDPNILDARQRIGAERQDRPYTPDRERETERRPDECEHDALGKKLAHDAELPGTECPPNRHLARSGRTARKQEVGQIGTADEQNEADHGQHHHERTVDVADDGCTKRDDRGCTPFGVRCRVRGGKACGDHVEIGVSLVEPHAFPEPRHTLVSAIVPVAWPDQLIAQHRFGHPDVRVWCRESECGWHDPYNRERTGTKLHCRGRWRRARRRNGFATADR